MVTAGTGFVPHTVSTGGVDLISNDHYVLFASISPYYALDATIGAGNMGGDLRSGGTSSTYFAWANNSGDFASLFTGSWANTGCVDSGCGQAAFVLDYSSPTVTPEVPTVVLFGTGLLGILFVLWKRV